MIHSLKSCKQSEGCSCGVNWLLPSLCPASADAGLPLTLTACTQLICHHGFWSSQICVTWKVFVLINWVLLLAHLPVRVAIRTAPTWADTHEDRFYVWENVANVFVLNLHQLRKDAYPDLLSFGLFSFCSSYTQQDNQPTFTQTFVLMTFSAQRTIFWLIGFLQLYGTC